MRDLVYILPEEGARAGECWGCLDGSRGCGKEVNSARPAYHTAYHLLLLHLRELAMPSIFMAKKECSPIGRSRRVSRTVVAASPWSPRWQTCLVTQTVNQISVPHPATASHRLFALQEVCQCDTRLSGPVCSWGEGVIVGPGLMFLAPLRIHSLFPNLEDFGSQASTFCPIL